jgi:hypothetical protein
MPRNYKRAQSEELKEYKGVQRISGGVQLKVRTVPVECPAGRKWLCVR